MKKKYYIVGSIYTYDLMYWNYILKTKNISHNNYKKNKFFIEGVPIEKIPNNKFIELTKDFCIIEDNRPDDPITIDIKYILIYYAFRIPGIKLIRDFKYHKKHIVANDDFYSPFWTDDALERFKKAAELFHKSEFNQIINFWKKVKKDNNLYIPLKVFAEILIEEIKKHDQSTQEEFNIKLGILEKIVEYSKNKKEVYN